jgi:hypothetical protein
MSDHCAEEKDDTDEGISGLEDRQHWNDKGLSLKMKENKLVWELKH